MRMRFGKDGEGEGVELSCQRKEVLFAKKRSEINRAVVSEYRMERQSG